jgi:hydroxyacylglutathione hydrolase
VNKTPSTGISLPRFLGVSSAVIVATLVATAQQAPPAPPKPGVPGVQYPMSRITPDAEYAISGSPDWLAMGEDQVWTNSRSIDIVSRMDPYSNKTVAVVPVKNPCSGLVIAHGTLWVPSCTEGAVYRVDTKTNMVVAKVPVPPAHNEGGIAYGAGTIWLPTDPKGMVARIDPATNGVAARIPVAPGSFTVIFGYGRAWVSSTEKNLVSAIDPATNTVTEILVDIAPRFMAVGEGFVWTLNQGKGTVTKIDPVSMKVVATIAAGVPGGGGDIAAGEGAVWVTAREIPVTRIDARTNTVTHQFVGPGGDAIRVLHGSVWLSNGRWSNVWRIPANQIASMAPAKLAAAPLKAELDSARALAAKAPNPTGPVQPLSAFVEPGALPKAWAVSGPNCMEMPAWQVHEYNPNFFILRQSGCIHYEKPFLYLIFGKDKALLEDTGAGQIDSASVVMDLIAKWSKRNNKTGPIPLIVVHSHSHGDHTAGDAGFRDKPNVQFVAATVPELQKAFGIKTWPTEIASIDLGGRVLDVIPIPGHDAASIALYDRQTAVLLTGDSFYPGRLYVGDAEFPAFAASTQRLVDFTKDKPVAHILGTHIEQTSTPFVDYPRGTVYQPHEHVLELTRGTLLELNDALIQLNGKLQRVVLRDVILSPRAPRN